MTERLLHLLEQAGQLISYAGVLVIVGGFLATAVHNAIGFRRLGSAQAFKRFRGGLAHSLLMGLEILVVADVIETITVEPTFASLCFLALLVLLRTFLSWTLSLEVEGRWPWQTAAEA